MAKREIELAIDALDAIGRDDLVEAVRSHIMETDRFITRVDDTLLQAYKAFVYILDTVGPISDASSDEETKVANCCASLMTKIGHDIVIPTPAPKVSHRTKRPCLDPEKMKGFEDQFGGEDFPTPPAEPLL